MFFTEVFVTTCNKIEHSWQQISSFQSKVVFTPAHPIYIWLTNYMKDTLPHVPCHSLGNICYSCASNIPPDAAKTHSRVPLKEVTVGPQLTGTPLPGSLPWLRPRKGLNPPINLISKQCKEWHVYHQVQLRATKGPKALGAPKHSHTYGTKPQGWLNTRVPWCPETPSTGMTLPRVQVFQSLSARIKEAPGVLRCP